MIAVFVFEGDFVPVPCTMSQWVAMIEDAENLLVERTTVNGVTVSTVFLGMEHGHDKHGRPLLFETTRTDTWDPMIRHATVEEARVAHKDLVAKLQ